MVKKSYWDVNTTGQLLPGAGTGLTTAEMIGSGATKNMVGFNFTSPWSTSTDSDDYPILPWQGLSPVASFTFSPETPTLGGPVTFDASGSSDPDRRIQTYKWDFGDGTTATGETVTHSFSGPGDYAVYTVELTVADSGRASSTTQTVTVEEILPPSVQRPLLTGS